MKALADALVYAVTYIDIWPDQRSEFLDDDVGALESIASYLNASTDQEKDALAEAAERALAEERAFGRPRDSFTESYARFMESLFEGWEGNRRIAE